MSDPEYRGPAFTYVTDEELDRPEQERVLREFIAGAGVQPLRVAFRLPKWSDADFLALLDWYLDQAKNLGPEERLEPPLVHDRPEATERFPETVLWLPWRNRDLIRPDDVGNLAMSVHSVDEAHEAVSVGASELMFGHVFTSESHPGSPGRGVAALNDVKEAVKVYQHPPRVTAIGGVNEHTIAELGQIRHCRVAAIRTISRSQDIRKTIDRIRSSWVAARINAELDENQRNPFGNPSSIFF